MRLRVRSARIRARRGSRAVAKLTAERRNKLPDKSFAGPDRSYPIQDRSHAVNALARVSQYGDSELKARVRRKVHEKYPGLGKD